MCRALGALKVGWCLLQSWPMSTSPYPSSYRLMPAPWNWSFWPSNGPWVKNYLLGWKSVVYTDNKSLSHLSTAKLGATASGCTTCCTLPSSIGLVKVTRMQMPLPSSTQPVQTHRTMYPLAFQFQNHCSRLLELIGLPRLLRPPS